MTHSPLQHAITDAQAVPTKDVYRTDIDYVLAVDEERIDLLVDVDSLVIDGKKAQPQRGDLFHITSDSMTTTYEVLPSDQSEKCWRYCDTGHSQYRIHALKTERTTIIESS